MWLRQKNKRKVASTSIYITTVFHVSILYDISVDMLLINPCLVDQLVNV
jgi:hypothetical protein